MRRAVHVVHQLREARKLRVVAVCAKVRRTVAVGEEIVKCVRHKVIYAAHKQEVHQPFHDVRAFCPTVCAEHLAHGAAVHVRILPRVRSRKLPQNVVEEFAVHHAARDERRRFVVGHSGHYLVQHNVYATHVLPVESAEVMSRTAPKTRVRVHVFNQMPNVLHTVRTAPIAERIGEILFPKQRHGAHVRKANFRGQLVMCIPQNRQIERRLVDAVFCHVHGGRVAPRQHHAGLANRTIINAGVVPRHAKVRRIKARLIGEKSRERVAKILCIVVVMRLVHGFNELVHRFF